MCCVTHKNVQWLIGLEKRIWIHISFFFIPAFFFRSSAVAVASPPLCMESEAALVTIWWSPGLFPGFPTRMGYLYYISCLRYAILIGNPSICTLYTELHPISIRWSHGFQWLSKYGGSYYDTANMALTTTPTPSLSLSLTHTHSLLAWKKSEVWCWRKRNLCQYFKHTDITNQKHSLFKFLDVLWPLQVSLSFYSLHCISIRVGALSLVFIPGLYVMRNPVAGFTSYVHVKNEQENTICQAMYLYT